MKANSWFSFLSGFLVGVAICLIVLAYRLHDGLTVWGFLFVSVSVIFSIVIQLAIFVREKGEK